MRDIMSRARKAFAPCLKKAGVGRLYQYLRSWNKPNAVFIWIPKTAGTSICQMLAQYGGPKLKEIPLVRDYFPNKGIVTFGHMDYAKLVAEKYVSASFDRHSYKFCFSRNPYSRAVSLYFYSKDIGRLDEHISFLDFCRGLVRNGVPDIGLYNSLGLSQCNPQSRWLRDVKIDYVGKLENLMSDLRHVFSHLGLPPPHTIPRVNATSHMDYRSYYCEESKRIVEEYYAQDFATFGYEVQQPLCCLER